MLKGKGLKVKLNFSKWGMLALAVVVAFGSMGYSYACHSRGGGWGWGWFNWGSRCVCTPTCDVQFMWVEPNDDGTYNPSIDPGDDGGYTHYDFGWGTTSSDDPSAQQTMGSGCGRYDKDVARTTASIVGCDKNSINVIIENAYPSYYPTVFFGIKNKGTLTAEIKSIVLEAIVDNSEPDPLDKLDISWSGIWEGQEIPVCAEVAGALYIHVKQEAKENATYKFRLTVNFECECVIKKCDTAYAYGGCYAKCFLWYGFRNWGWTNGPLRHGTYHFPLYAGAAHCNISKGKLVGWVDIVYSGSTVTVTYTMNSGYTMDETHVYAGTNMFPRNKWGRPTVSPGQYTKSHDLTNATTDTYTINGLPSNSNGKIYVIAHAVVCWNQ